MAYIENDDRGRSVYHVNWTNFKSSHLVLLMCVAGAVLEEPLSERWVKEFAGNLPEPKQPNIWPVFRVMKNHWKSEQEKLEARRAAIEAQKHV